MLPLAGKLLLDLRFPAEETPLASNFPGTAVPSPKGFNQPLLSQQVSARVRFAEISPTSRTHLHFEKRGDLPRN